MMFAVEGFVLAPTEGMIGLAKYLIFLVLIIHLPYVFMVIGGSTLSLLFNLLNRETGWERPGRFAREIVEKTLINPWVGLILGVFPLSAVTLLYYQILYDTPLTNFSEFWGIIPFDKWAVDTPTYPYHWWVAFGLVAVGFALLYIYKNTFSKREEKFPLHFLSGLAGLGALIGGYLVFTAQQNLILYPTMWNMVDNPLQMIFGSTILPAFGYLVHIGFLFAGAAILLNYHLNRPDKEEISEEDKDYHKFAKRTGLILTLVATLGLPVPILLNLWFLPEAAMAWPVIWGHLAAVVVAMVLAVTVGLALFNLNKKVEWPVAVMATLCVVLFLYNDQQTRATALTEQYKHLHEVAKKHHKPYNLPKLKGEGEGIVSKLPEAAQKGFALYKDVTKGNCKSCHSLTGEQIIGPSFKGLWGKEETVITDGKERTITVDAAYVGRSILDPSADKVKGIEAPMPPQSWTQEEIDAMVAFLKAIKDWSDEDLKKLQQKAK